jgi:hypothetical protein
MTVNSKEENFCPNYVQEFALWLVRVERCNSPFRSWLPFSGLMGDIFIHDVRNIEDSRERGHIEKG